MPGSLQETCFCLVQYLFSCQAAHMSSQPELHIFIPGLLDSLKIWKRDFDFIPQSTVLVDTLSACSRQRQSHNDWLTAAYQLLTDTHNGNQHSHANNCMHYDFADDGLDCNEESTNHGKQSVLLAHPIGLEAGMSDIMVSGEVISDLSAEEKAQLTDQLNKHFAQDGWTFRISPQGHWYLQLPAKDKPTHTIPLQQALGNSLRALQEGTEAVSWSKQLNELQMLLYSSPVNQAREAQRKMPVSSFWLWDIDVPQKAGETSPKIQYIAGGGYDGKVMAQASSLPWITLRDFSRHADSTASAILLYPELVSAGNTNNLARWQEQLNELEQWLRPLLENKNRKILIHTCNGVTWQLSGRWAGNWLGRLTRGLFTLRKKSLLDFA